jgi:hypothetical protein
MYCNNRNRERKMDSLVPDAPILYDPNPEHVAYVIGHTARVNGIAKRCNQFFKDTEAWQQWNHGWSAAHEKLKASLQPGERVTLRWVQ